MFYWQIRQFSLGSIQFQEELHLKKRKKNTFQCSDQFSNLQLVYFQRYTRLYPVNTMFFMCFACFIDRFVNFRKVSFSFSKSNIPIQERRIHFQCNDQFSNLQLFYFQRYTRIYLVNTMFFMCFACFIDRFVNFR